MQIFVKGLQGKTHTVNVESNDSIKDVKSILETRIGIPSESQRLIYGSSDLSSNTSMEVIPDNSTLHLSLALLGGGKKRKKKTYTTPKRIPHVRKKVKLAVLNYYSVKDGKVSKLRRQCEESTCGGGIFMARHKDRQTCGHCGMTYALSEADKAAASGGKKGKKGKK